MIGIGFAEILVLALMSGGMNSTDLAELIQPAHYFATRRIEPTNDRLIDIVITEPKTAKAQIMQLTALRFIADEADRFKKAKNYPTNREAIEEIAQGKRAQDAQGFAQEYAKRVLAKLDGAKIASAKVRPMRQDALNWFPADLTIGYALDMRQSRDLANDTLKDLMKALPNAAKIEMYEQLEKLGNIRIERAAVGFVDAPKRDDQKIFVRMTGKANQAWVADALATLSGGEFQSKRLKADDGTPILLMWERQGPAVLLVGDTDLLVVGYSKHDGKHEDVVSELLDVRAKKKPNASAGPLKERLAKIPDKAIALLVGDLSEQMRKDLGVKLEPAPSKISAYIERTPMGMDCKMETAMSGAEEAGKFVQKVAALRKQGIAALQEAMKEPPPPGTPPVPLQAIINLVENVQVQSQDEKVLIRGFVPNALIQQLGQMSLFYAGRGELEPLPKELK
jgi:hypothetical protein